MEQKNKAIVLAINDGRKGHFNQILGVLNNLPFKHHVINLTPSKIGKLPNELVIYNALGISRHTKHNFNTFVDKNDFPLIVLSAGRKSFAFARYIKKQALKAGKKTILCQFMYPNFKSKDADLIFVTDKKYCKKSQNNNVVYKELAANNINSTVLNESSLKLRQALKEQNLKEPYTTLMLGGNHKNKVVYSKQDAINMAENLAKSINAESGTLLISTSRRTPKEFSDKLYKECKKRFKNIYFYNFLENNLCFNPYYGFFNVANNIIVTYDSVSMISEACSLGSNTPIWIYDNFVVKYAKFDLYKKLQNKGYVANFSSFSNNFTHKDIKNIPNYTKQIAEEILQKYNDTF